MGRPRLLNTATKSAAVQNHETVGWFLNINTTLSQIIYKIQI